MVGALDQHDGGVGHIHADLDDGGGDQDIILAVAEGQHDGVLLFGLHAPVQETQFQLAEDLLLQAGMFLRGGEQFALFALFHQRVDNEGLVPALDLAFHEGIGAFAFGGGEDIGLDGLAAGGQLVHDGKVKVAVDGEGERTRDGGGGHDEQVRVGALGAQEGALLDAEAVLFVNGDKLQVLEGDRVFEQGMRADDDQDGCHRQARGGSLPFRRREYRRPAGGSGRAGAGHFRQARIFRKVR